MSNLRKASQAAYHLLGICTPDKKYNDDYLEREFIEMKEVREALRAALAEPEQKPIQPEAVTKHLQNMDIDEREDLCSWSFSRGVRWAEKQHGIRSVE